MTDETLHQVSVLSYERLVIWPMLAILLKHIIVLQRPVYDGTAHRNGCVIEILLVDSYVVVREGLRALIATEPDMIVLGEAGDRQAAVEKTKVSRPNLVVLDPASLGQDGIVTISDLKRINPEINILVLTDFIDSEGVRSVLQAGARGYVLKGTTALELIQSIRDTASTGES